MLEKYKGQAVDTILRAVVRQAFASSFPELDQDVVSTISVEVSKGEQFGDYQCNACMALAKRLKLAPRAMAEQVAVALGSHEALAKVEVAGPGFINLHLETSWVEERLMDLLEDDHMCVSQEGAGRTVILDYSSPNVAKPMHIGHIRSTVIGNALDRLYRRLGFNVIADNHIGDWGTQFGILMLGYRNFLDEANLAAQPVEELERVYVKSYECAKQDDTWMDKARSELVKLQQGDAENLALWKRFVELSMTEFERIYSRLGVSFDLVRGESWYHDRLPAVVEQLQAAGLAEESEGAQVVFLDDDHEDVCIVKKKDGGFNYATTDLATVLARSEEFAPERIIYVTDERQQRHFRQFFDICGRLGVKTKLVHVWFGLMRLPEATFSTREGNVIKLEMLLNKAEEMALKLVQTSSPNMDPDTQKEVARAVGIGAIKYADLSQNPQSMVTFTWDKALSLDGNSAPYLQYAYARIASVRDKYQELFPEGKVEAWPIRLTESIERQLALKLVRYPMAVSKSAELYRPSMLADYLYDVAQTYSSFYQNVNFLKAEEGTRESRVRLCGLTASVLRDGLSLLGIETPDRI